MEKLKQSGAPVKRAQVTTYLNSFMLSVLFTLSAYALVVQHTLSNHVLIGVIVVLALVQFVVQMVGFLHIGAEAKPRWKLIVFWGMLLVVCILVFGSLWIMNNLNYNMTPAQMNAYMQSQDGL